MAAPLDASGPLPTLDGADLAAAQRYQSGHWLRKRDLILFDDENIRAMFQSWLRMILKRPKQ
ncbi:MAG: hypothetical protein HWE37_00895 [Rhodobacteraceae bacterium]|nr:hypothetical protein [Paracoccaceae bacterium]